MYTKMWLFLFIQPQNLQIKQCLHVSMLTLKQFSFAVRNTHFNMSLFFFVEDFQRSTATLFDPPKKHMSSLVSRH